MTLATLDVSEERIRSFCVRWSITELALFGSVLRDDFGPNSDIDVLATFDSASQRTLLDEAQMEIELEDIFGRKVDLLSRSAVERSPNWVRRQEILSTAVRVYAR
jgi:predicted nucleotidyltransferase